MTSEHTRLDRSSAGAHDERRSHPRFSPQRVESLLGRVVDLSVSGMRVVHEGRAVVEVDETFDMLLEHRDRDVLVPVRVVWVEPIGERRQAMGLEVTRPSPTLEQQILALHPEQPSDAHGDDEALASEGLKAFRLD